MTPWCWWSPRPCLSLQFTNRCLLKWLKLWDPVVFGRERPARKPRPSVEPARVGKEATASSRWKSHQQVLEDMLEAEPDPSQRPRQKVAVLRVALWPRGCPPGGWCLHGLRGSHVLTTLWLQLWQCQSLVWSVFS